MINPLPKQLNILLIILLVIILIGIPNKTSKDVAIDGSYIVLEATQSAIFVGNTYINIIEDTSENYSPELISLAIRIIQCESGWDYKAQNKDSTAYGFSQFLSGTWDYVQKKWGMKLDRNSPEDQIYATLRLLKEEGDKPWQSSKSCWNK